MAHVLFTIERPKPQVAWLAKLRKSAVLIDNIYCKTGEGGGKDPTCTKEDNDQATGTNVSVSGAFDSTFTPSEEYEFEQQEEFYASIRDEDDEYTKALDAYTSSSEQMNAFLRHGEDNTDEIDRLRNEQADLERSIAEIEKQVESEEDEDKIDQMEEEMQGYETDLEHTVSELEELERFENDYDMTPQEACDYLEELIHKSPPLGDDIRVVRGLSGRWLQDLKPGDVMTDNGFMSTTTSPRVADRFGGSFLQLSVEKGTSCLYYPDRNEQELLFPQGTSIQVTGVKTSQGANGIKTTIVQGKVVKR